MSTTQSPLEPYKGLDPYEQADAEIFFGRKKDSRLIIANLYAAPLTILYGMSGVGKSSVLGAGVAPQIYQREDIIAVVFKDWEHDPLKKLKETVSETMRAQRKKREEKKKREEISVTQPPSNEPLVEPSTSEPLSEFLAGWAKLLKCRISIILDQFEDYLQYQQHKSFIKFADEFSTAVALSKARVSFLISIREDSLAKLDSFEGKIPSLFDNYLRLEHLDEIAGREVIVMPLDRYSELYVKDGTRYTIERELVDAVLEDVRVGSLARGSSGSKASKILSDKHKSEDTDTTQTKKYQLDTVFLQLVMKRLWQEEVKKGSHVLQLSTLNSLGGAHQIVQDHFVEVMKELDKEEQAIAAEVFKYLVSPSGTRIDYPVQELFGNEEFSQNQLPIVLSKLSKGSHRVLRQVAPTGIRTDSHYEIFHDALGPAILDWMTRFALAQEKRRSGKLRSYVGLLSLVAVLLVITWFDATKQRRAADSARTEALQQKDRANAQKKQYENTLKIMKEKELAIPFTKAVMNGHTMAIKCVALSSDNKQIVTGSDDGTAKVWTVSDGSLVANLVKHDAPINDVAFSPDGKLIATASQDKTARIWDLNGTIIAVIKHEASINSVNFSFDGARLVTASSDKTAQVWVVAELTNAYLNQAEPRNQVALNGHQGAIRRAEFSSDGNLVVTASDDGTAAIWDAKTGYLKNSLIGHTRGVLSAKFSNDLKTVVTASQDGTARSWDASRGNQLNELRHEGSVNSAEFNYNDELVVTASSDGTARIWEVRKLNTHKTLSGHRGKVNTAKFSADGGRVVTASDDTTARIWNAVTGKALIPLQGHLNEVNSAIFSSDGRLVITISNDQTARVWDASQFGGFQVLEAHAEQVNSQGSCSAPIKLNGRIVVAEGSGEVRYRFLLGGKPIYSGQKVIVDSNGTNGINYLMGFVKLGSSIRAGKLSLEITEPSHVVSTEVLFNYRCYNAKPAEPSTPPEDAPPSK